MQYRVVVLYPLVSNRVVTSDVLGAAFVEFCLPEMSEVRDFLSVCYHF